MTHAPDKPEVFSEAAWSDVIVADDRTYSEIVAYQERLEAQNRSTIWSRQRHGTG